MDLGYICGDEAEGTTVQKNWEDDIKLIRPCGTLTSWVDSTSLHSNH